MKMKKIVALATASALCLGMSVTAFATENPSPNEGLGKVKTNVTSQIINNENYIQVNDLTDVDEMGRNKVQQEIYTNLAIQQYGSVDKVPADMVDNLESQAKDDYNEVIATFQNKDNKLYDVMKTELAKKGLGFKKDAELPVVVCASNFTLRKAVTDQDGTVHYEPITDPNDPELKKGITQEFELGAIGYKGLKSDDVISVLHYKADGTWELIPATIRVDGTKVYAKATFTSLSPVAFVRMSNGDIVEVNPQTGEPVKDEKGNLNVLNKPATKDGTKTTTVATGRSPKTGEF